MNGVISMNEVMENILKKKKESAVYSLLNRYKFIFENLPLKTVMFELTKEGFPTKIIDANIAFRDIFHYSKEELPLISIFDIFNHEKLEPIREMMKNLVKTGEHKGMCEFYIASSKDEREYYVNAIMTKYMDHNIVIMTLNER